MRNESLSMSEYSGTSTRSWATIAPANQRSTLIAVEEGNASNHPTTAAPEASRQAIKPSRCRGPAP
jgi:hypothetical protein